MTLSTDHSADVRWLFAQKPLGRMYGIDRMRVLAEALGRPERTVPCIHVAGTNGKGSVAAMLDAIFRHRGYRVGLYTSPHLVHVGERVQVDRQPLNDGQVSEYLRELRPVADRLAAREPDLTPSFFEYMTAMAMLEFARRECDIAILEVGLGGRLDATNIVTPRVSVITSIGLDHCEILGDTIEQIATEKAGIIKPGVPVVVGRVPAGARRVIAEIAADRRSPVAWVEDRFGDGKTPLPTTSLEGEYQRWNAATATLAAEAFAMEPQATPADPLDFAAMSRGAIKKLSRQTIESALRAVEWPGRWQRCEIDGRSVILDASHNPEGAEALDANLRALVAAGKGRPVVVVGVLGVARARPLLQAIARHAAAIHLVVPNDPRACGYADLRALIPADFRGDVIDDTIERLFPKPGQVCDGVFDPTVCSGRVPPSITPILVVTGSIYLIGEVMKRLG